MEDKVNFAAGKREGALGHIKERLDRLRKTIQETDFLEGKGLSNEVNIRMFCYDPKDEMAVRKFTEQIVSDQGLECHIVERNLYQIFLELCDDIDISCEDIAEMEENDGKAFLLESLQDAIRVKSYIEKMRYEPHQKGDVLLVTGIGDVFPFMRIHILLAAIQKAFEDIPVLVLYPGNFDGRFVQLFNLLKPNEYYRAFDEI